MRFDARSLHPTLLGAIEFLNESDTVSLGKVADVFMPKRFKRVYVEPEHGLPFLKGSHVIHFQAAGLEYLSWECEGIDELLVKEGWLLVTRSGTVGRVVMCPIEWDSWVATEDIIRVVPKDKRFPAGYLCSFLPSSLAKCN